MVNIRIQRPRIRREFTALKDWEPPFTWAMARVLPWVGRTLPVLRGIQSIWFLKTAVWGNMISYVLCASLRARCLNYDIIGVSGTEGGRAYQVSVLFGRNPYVPVTPFAQVAEFLDFGVVVLDVVFHGEAGGVVDADVAAESPENSAGFVGCEAGERPISIVSTGS